MSPISNTFIQSEIQLWLTVKMTRRNRLPQEYEMQLMKLMGATKHGSIHLLTTAPVTGTDSVQLAFWKSF